MPYPGQPLTQRVQIGKSPFDCWIWLGPTTEVGHGKITFGGRDMLAHRWLWEQLFGPIPPGAVIYSICDIRGCVNPHHLECDHYATSCRRRTATKLLPQEVAEIRAAQATAKPATAGILAARYGTSKQTIRDIWAGRSWARADRGQRRLHRCSVCGECAEWSETWSWYGSYLDADDGKVAKFCSQECRAKESADTVLRRVRRGT